MQPENMQHENMQHENMQHENKQQQCLAQNSVWQLDSVDMLCMLYKYMYDSPQPDSEEPRKSHQGQVSNLQE